MLSLQQLLNETTTLQSNGGPETTETIVRDDKAPGAQKEPRRNADSSSIVVDDTSRKTNTPVFEEIEHSTSQQAPLIKQGVEGKGNLEAALPTWLAILSSSRVPAALPSAVLSRSASRRRDFYTEAVQTATIAA